MNKKCARCDKIVYPIEELKCLDKLWHRQCFKCQVCNMALNMRNYKGFNKNPYCEAHIPKAKATTVAETPELKRIAENTKLQSNVKYHAEFEKTKGKLTQVADDPETLRIKQNSQIISNIAYHGDLKKKAEMEQRRLMTNENEQPIDHNTAAIYSEMGYVNNKIQQEANLPTMPSNYNSGSNVVPTLIYNSNSGGAVPVSHGRAVGSIADLDPVNNCYGSLSSGNSRVLTNAGPPNHQKLHQQPVHHTVQQTARPDVLTTGVSVYRAIYDYEARESDEVSFRDGDIILNCSQIHEGWMSGLVQRTGLCGLLPANYVESVVL